MTALWTRGHVQEVGTAAASGVVLGVVSRLGDQLPASIAGLANIGGPWLVVAFALGPLARKPSRGAVFGALSLTCAVASYYGYIKVVQGGANRSHLGSTAVFWLIAGSGAGAMFGYAGQQWRRGRQGIRVVSVVLLTGALLGEGIAIGILHTNPVSWIVAAAEVTTGLISPIILLRHEALNRMVAASGIGAATVGGAIATAVLSYLAGRIG